MSDSTNPKSPKLGVNSGGIKKTPSGRKEEKSQVKEAVKEALDKDGVVGDIGNTKGQVGVSSNEDYSAEYDVKHPTAEKMRNKVRALLQKALCTDKPDAPEAEMIAAAIEQRMFDKYKGDGPPYKTKYRNLSFNLKDAKNTQLREDVLAKLLPPSKLIEMSSEELANDELKKTRAETEEKLLKDAQPFNKPQASTDQFKCGKCKERKCTYYQMQTRSADEPLTTFVQCVNCGNRWRF